jgi:hypothetical protein
MGKDSGRGGSYKSGENHERNDKNIANTLCLLTLKVRVLNLALFGGRVYYIRQLN